MVTAALKKKIRRILEDSGIDCAEFETEQLLKWSLGENYYITGFDGEIEGGREKTLTEAAIRRARGEPLQYILGEWEIRSYIIDTHCTFQSIFGNTTFRFHSTGIVH